MTTTHARPRTQKQFPNKSLTQQCDRDRCDIQNILKSYKTTGVCVHRNTAPARYDTSIDANDFHTSQNILAKAKSQFAELPSYLRRFFLNDPANYISFCENPENREEMQKLHIPTDHFPPIVLDPDPKTNPPSPPPKQPTNPEPAVTTEAPPASNSSTEATASEGS